MDGLLPSMWAQPRLSSSMKGCVNWGGHDPWRVTRCKEKVWNEVEAIGIGVFGAIRGRGPARNAGSILGRRSTVLNSGKCWRRRGWLVISMLQGREPVRARDNLILNFIDMIDNKRGVSNGHNICLSHFVRALFHNYLYEISVRILVFNICS